MLFSLRNKWVAAVILATLAVAGLATFILKKKSNSHTPYTIEQIPLEHNQNLGVAHIGTPEKGVLIYIAENQNESTASTIRQFAELSYYVAIVNNNDLLNPIKKTTTQCLNIAESLKNISHQVQSHFNLDEDDLPILVGDNASAATVYATLAQADEHQFHAAVGINFSTHLSAHNSLCNEQNFTQNSQHQEQSLTPVKRLPTSLYVFQNKGATPNLADEVFSNNISNLKLTIADGKKQIAQAEAIQILQWLDPRLTDQISSDTSGGDLPLIDVDIDRTQSPPPPESESFALILTGDGGWAEIDKSVARILAEKGVPTVALDSLSYFWKTRSPEETAEAIETIISQYLEKWHKKKVILIGYSFGADVLPIVANTLNTQTQDKISLVALLGMGKTAAFEFRLSSWMNADTNPNRLPILPAIEKMTWANTICIYGVNDDEANCLPTEKLGVKIISMPGDHHFDEKYGELVQHILENEKRD